MNFNNRCQTAVAVPEKGESAEIGGENEVGRGFRE